MSSAPAPLLFVELLSNRQGRLGALRWGADMVSATTRPWAGPTAWPQVHAILPGFWTQTTSPEVWTEVLTPAGLRPLESANVAPCPPDGLTRASTQWVSGSWYLRPPTQANAAQAASRTRALQLLELVATDADTRVLENVFRQDAMLSYQLLRVVNSLAMGGHREITSFGQAILIMGRQQLRRWLNLLLFTARDDDPRSAMLMAHVTLRARGMELLAHAAGLDKTGQDQAFMAGMFSMLGILFGQPLTEVLLPLQLTDELQTALLEQHGELGRLLQAWQSVEQADTKTLVSFLAKARIYPEQFNSVLVDACLWMLQLMRQGAGAAHG